MKPIHLQITITPDDDTVKTLVELLRRVRSAASGIDEQREARIRASQYAHFGGQKPPDDEGLLIDMKAAAKLLDLSERTVWGMANSGRMPKPIRIGRAVRWSYEELRAWVNAGCPPQGEWKRPC